MCLSICLSKGFDNMGRIEIGLQLTVTLNEAHGHPNWYQKVEISGLYHESKRSVRIRLQAKVHFFTKSLKTGSLP